MKKEVIIAIVFGLVVGLGITFITAVFRRDNSQEEQNKNIANRIALETTTQEDDHSADGVKVKILSPTNETVVTEPNITLSGRGLGGSLLVIFINDQDQIITTPDNGEFSVAVKLETGSNVVSIHAVDEAGQTYTDQITLIYTNKSLEETLVSDQEVKDAAASQK